MSTATLELTKQAMTLPADERVLLALRLWESVQDFVDPDIEQAWLEEVETRWSEIKDGIVECLPVEEVMKKASIRESGEQEDVTGLSPKQKLEQLNLDLDHAVQEERFEDAAQIRDEIKDLKNELEKN